MDDRDDSREEEGGTGFGVRDAVAAVRRHAWLLVLLVCVGGAIAASIASLLPNAYDAMATVQIDPRKKTIVSLDSVLPDLAGDTPTIESQVEIIRSRVIALRVIEALGLRDDAELTEPPLLGRLRALLPFQPARVEVSAPARADAIQQRLEAAEAARSAAGPSASDVGNDRPVRDDVADAFASRMKAARVRNSLVVEITFRSRDPVKAARIANTVAEVYIRDQVDMKMRATTLAAELLEKKLGGLRAGVAEAERRIAHFKAEHGIFDAEGHLLSEKQLSRLMEQTVTARNATTDARARYEELQSALQRGEDRNIADVLQSVTVRSLKDQLVHATRHEAELLTKYGPKHPELIKARAEIADIDSKLTREIDQVIANMKHEYGVALERERQLDQSLTKLKDQQSVSREVSIQLQDFEREAATSRQVLDAFLARYKQTVESQDLNLPDARIVEKAAIPSAIAGPKRKMIVLGGLAGGAGLGLGLTLLLELMTPGLVRPGDTETTLGVAHLASVPQLQAGRRELSEPMLALRIVLAEPRGAFTRSIARLEAELGRRRADAAPRIILVASSLPNEGKSVVAANLALRMSMRGRSTLLIDADLRRSKISQQLGLDRAPGLMDAICHGQDFESVILRDTVSGLAVIPAGGNARVVLGPAEALQSPGFAQRLARLKAHFDTIIIDSPPLLPVVDARILAGYADEIVMLAAWQRTPKALVRRAVSLLGSDATKITGMVINRVTAATPAGPAAARRPQQRGHQRSATRVRSGIA